MAKTPQKDPQDMTNDELRDNWYRFHNRAAKLHRGAPWAFAGVAAVCAVASGVMALCGVPYALAVLAFGISGGAGTMSFMAMGRDHYNDKAFWLSSENKQRLIIAEAENKRAEEKAARALREEFEGAMQAMSEGRGTDKDVKVGRALRLKSKALFGVHSS
jgi:hypothetical protein